MRFLVDESTGTAVAQYLRDNGHDVLAVGEVMPEADDALILARGASEGRIVVTNDKDFGELVFRSGMAHQGVLFFRLKDASATNRVRVLDAVLKGYAEHLPNHFTVATETHIRIRPTTP